MRGAERTGHATQSVRRRFPAIPWRTAKAHGRMAMALERVQERGGARKYCKGSRSRERRPKQAVVNPMSHDLARRTTRRRESRSSRGDVRIGGDADRYGWKYHLDLCGSKRRNRRGRCDRDRVQGALSVGQSRGRPRGRRASQKLGAAAGQRRRRRGLGASRETVPPRRPRDDSPRSRARRWKAPWVQRRTWFLSREPVPSRP